MSVWMTPDLHPIYGGTYYPPNDRYYGQPGFTTVLKSLAEQVIGRKIPNSSSLVLIILFVDYFFGF